MRQRLEDAGAEMLAYLGPAIGPRHFEVGAEVREAMRTQLPDAEQRVRTARRRASISPTCSRSDDRRLRKPESPASMAAHDCTFSDPTRFYSFRRDGTTGRHAALDLARLTLHTRCGESARGDPNANFHSDHNRTPTAQKTSPGAPHVCVAIRPCTGQAGRCQRANECDARDLRAAAIGRSTDAAAAGLSRRNSLRYGPTSSRIRPSRPSRSQIRAFRIRHGKAIRWRLSTRARIC